MKLGGFLDFEKCEKSLMCFIISGISDYSHITRVFSEYLVVFRILNTFKIPDYAHIARSFLDCLVLVAGFPDCLQTS